MITGFVFMALALAYMVINEVLATETVKTVWE